MSRRTERIGSVIRSVIAEAIQSRLSDPRILPLTSITRVDVTEDLQLARVHVSVLAPPARRTLCVEALQSAAGRLRRLLAPELRLRKLPTLEFHLDESVQHAFTTVEAIDAAMREYRDADEDTRDEDDDEAADTANWDADDDPDVASPDEDAAEEDR